MSRLEIRMTKVHKSVVPEVSRHDFNPNLEEARETLLGLIDSIGEYETEADKSRAIALLITPMAVKRGHLTTEQCPPFKIKPKAAKEVFADILDVLYGEDAKLGCKLR